MLQLSYLVLGAIIAGAAIISLGIGGCIGLYVGNQRRHLVQQSLEYAQCQLEDIKASQELARVHQQELKDELKLLAEREQSLALSSGKFEQQCNMLTAQYETLQIAHQELQGNIEIASQKGAHQGSLLQATEVRLDEQLSKVQELKREKAEGIAKLEQLQQRFTSILEEHTHLKTTLDEREQSFKQQLGQFETQKKALSDEFKVLASEILESKTKALQESAKLSVTTVMNPFQKSIDDFKKEVQDIHHRETRQQGELHKELQGLKDLNKQMSQEAHELSVALKGQKKLQGNWGELILENVLDRSGLVLGQDYAREVSFSTEDGRQRPDAVIYLPQNKHLVIDAKVSLNAYTRYVNAEDDMSCAQALQEHVHAMKSRIEELAERDYYKLPGLNSPEIVFMFVPIESAFVEAMKADETLFTRAIENNVLVATPTTLLTSLNIVRQLWRYEDQNKHTLALADTAEQVFKKLNTFLSSFYKVKQSLGKATESYEQAEKQLLTGKGNLVKKVSLFKELAPSIKQTLPDYYVDKAELEVDLFISETALNKSDDLECDTEDEAPALPETES